MVLFFVVVVLLASIVPLCQFLFFKLKSSKNADDYEADDYEYIFSNELVNKDIDFQNSNQLPSRKIASSRGWIRGPQGEVMTNKDFEEKRNLEYSIDLP